ncbi:MAG: ATP-dependent DNA helicase [Lysobacterales bacterium]
MIDGFAPRAVQQQMAAAVARAIADNAELVVEAGTGTGKTFAYLVPAILCGQRVIVSTGTKALQDQLFDRDLPRVVKALGRGIKTALLKGRANYLCLFRLERSQGEGGFLSRPQIGELNRIAAWSKRTRSGDRSELDTVPEDAPIWARVTSTSENCLGQECPMFEDCHVVRARRAAQDADLVVVNHHLLFADLALKRDGFGEILPGAAVFILDEAHQIPELAGQFFGETLSTRQLQELVGDAQREVALVSGSRVALNEIGPGVEQWLRELRLAVDAAPARGAWPPLREQPAVAVLLEKLAAAIATLAEALAALAESSEPLAALAARAELLQERARLLSADAPERHVLWYETSERHLSVTATPLDVAAPLREFRQRQPAAWIFTSATLAVGGRFDHYTRAMGLEAAETLALPSPFDFATQSLCYLPAGLPAPNTPQHTPALIAAVRPVLAASAGRAFLLFTSHRALRLAAELLANDPWPLFVQGSAPRSALLEGFRRSGNGVLLGAASFWEGVDVRGDALSVVVIDKLPFAAPDDPVLEARIKDCREQGGNPFGELQIPAAAIALKQGVGRLIRDVADRGVLVLGDPRLTQMAYGKIFLNSLPPLPRTHAIEDVQAFFALGPKPSVIANADDW